MQTGTLNIKEEKRCIMNKCVPECTVIPLLILGGEVYICSFVYQGNLN